MASSVADSVGTEAKDSECSVCCEHFTVPKLLPCGHLLCHLCLVNIMKAQDDVRCPLCRDIIVTSADRQSKSVEDVASEFPTDLAMELILEADRILGKQHNCCVCEDVAATSMCLNCKDMLCQSCKRVHGKLFFSKHHTVEDLSTLTTEKLAANHSPPCSSHPEETPKLFCPTHGACICLLCASSKHRNCPEVRDMGEKIEETNALLGRLTAKLSEGESEFDKVINELDQHLQDIEKYTEAAIAEIDDMFDQLDAMVKEKRQQMKEKVVTARCNVREAVKEGKNSLLQKRTKLTTHGQVVKRVKGVKNHGVATTMSLQMEKCVDDLSFSTSLPKDAQTVTTFQFFQNPTVMAQIKQELTKLGEIKIMPAIIKANKISNKVRFAFHDNHGTSVMLSNNNRTASKSQHPKDGWNGIVFSRDPLDTNTLYEVQIDKLEKGRPVKVGFSSLLAGVGDSSPADVTLPTWSGGLSWPAWICCRQAYAYDRTLSANYNVGAALCSLGVNHRVGLALDSARSLHLYVDGQDQGIAAYNIPDPCYAMFDIVDWYEQVNHSATFALAEASHGRSRFTLMAFDLRHRTFAGVVRGAEVGQQYLGLDDWRVAITGQGRILFLASSTDGPDQMQSIQVYDLKKQMVTRELTDPEATDITVTDGERGLESFHLVDDTTVIAGYSDHQIRVFHIDTGSVLHRLPGHQTCTRIFSAPDSGLLVSADWESDDAEFRVWRKRDFTRVTTLHTESPVNIVKLLLVEGGKGFILSSKDHAKPTQFTLQGRDKVRLLGSRTALNSTPVLYSGYNGCVKVADFTLQDEDGDDKG